MSSVFSISYLLSLVTAFLAVIFDPVRVTTMATTAGAWLLGGFASWLPSPLNIPFDWLANFLDTHLIEKGMSMGIYLFGIIIPQGLIKAGICAMFYMWLAAFAVNVILWGKSFVPTWGATT